MEDSFSGFAERYYASGRTLRGVFATSWSSGNSKNICRARRVVDAGGGAGHQTIPLARKGYEVTILDPSRSIVREARRALVPEEDDVSRRIRPGESTGELTNYSRKKSFGAVLCPACCRASRIRTY